MTVPTSRYEIKYKGGSTAAATFFIPFGFTALTTVHVDVIDSAGARTAQTKDVHYTITATNSDGSSTPITQSPAEGGWIRWIGTSPSDIVHIYREESAEFTAHFPEGISDTEVVEQAMDNITRSMSRTIIRSESSPEKFNAQDRPIKDVGTPKRGDDAITRQALTNMDISPSLSIPLVSGSQAHKFLSPSAYVPASAGASAYTTMGEVPATPSDTRKVLKSNDSGFGSWAWTEVNWIPTAPNDNNGYFLSTSSSGVMDWSRLYEVPMTAAGSTNDIIQVKPGDNLGWRTLPAETPYATATAGKVDRFAMNVSGSPAWGPRISTGSVSVSPTCPAITANMFGKGWHGGNGGGSVVTFSVAHGMKNDLGADVAPDRVHLMIETAKHQERSASGGVDSIPFWVVKLFPSDHASTPGITSTTLNGVAMYLNVNDGISDETSEPNYITVFNLLINSGGAAAHTFKVNFMAFKD